MKTFILTGVLALLSGGPLTAMADQGRWYSTDHMWGSGGWMWGSMFMWTILIALVILGLFAFSKSRLSSDTNQTMVTTPLDLLNARYAKGEINQQEYESHKKTLQS